ncbi:hypothetical protein A1O3_07114 [Capronia epimyces CBS 606.96]|uniref:Monopolin complex subunit Csm1/Pcs1 C-terminal domain-containing protein n=1 Tax=Capronia epimyces CBS 606.96 TaxID=1182542 RepID=W9XU38_9EURO|nr:uncharacterized protein A1O3_07114 [Capronia epimyces CBS 606.96]EXJ80830.1 hypothetical protein A1O3_07114 [Capronia epimyces CBS 606.96]
MKGIADLVESAMEESTDFIDENSILSSASDATAASTAKSAPAKRGKKRHRVTMPSKPKSKVQKSAPAPAAGPGRKTATKRMPATKRKALEDHLENTDVNGNQDLEASEVVQEVSALKPKKPSRAKAKPNATKETAGTNEMAEDIMETEGSPVIVRSKHAASRNTQDAPKVRVTNRTKAAPKAKAVQQASSADPEMQDDEVEEIEEDPKSVVTVAIPKRRTAMREASRTRQESGYRRRAESASDAERGDPNLRRKLGDITRKLENVDLKYRNLKDVGINEANANMEKVRKQCDAAMQASNELIASLRKELAMQAPLAQEARQLKKQFQTQEEEMATMRQTLSGLENSLSAAQNENKALQAKLAAARAPSVDNAKVKTPGSAIKAAGHRPLMIASAEAAQAAQAAQTAQMKEDLYSDLTGLIIRSVKRTEEGDTYDCIQTGRNGTLHFKLYVDQEDARTASFEETEFLYTPLLDANQDRAMIDLMPSYLTEDITFARQNAAKFYGRVVDTLTKRRTEE